ncbi:hypothetical protein PV367_33205 [Streptomyces europaeiscabiei]|uniref:Uncharacterized protein n=1 Tax=Streptomyces europaeiscabiei TaxID=146819 RepID=A0AAJ2PVN0_9ACTN|nr:hypothetical protein [Streptomyces europaeiscabiei]MDX3134540.1 hypothetical protein [Streptomyces europaeiscabiei]
MSLWPSEPVTVLVPDGSASSPSPSPSPPPPPPVLSSASVTVRVKGEVRVVPAEFLNTARYSYPSCAARALKA